ncbi:transcription elongation factor spt5 [Phlyctochytrium bullatum]|nr:transcription elongation factor spt5 [Phlyctochytrium bullatum]
MSSFEDEDLDNDGEDVEREDDGDAAEDAEDQGVDDGEDDDDEAGRSKSRYDDDEDEDDEDDDDYDEDEEEEDTGRRKRKKRKKRDAVSRFFDEEAAVDDEDEEDEDEDEDEIIQRDEDFEEVQNDSYHIQLDRKRREQEDLDAEAVADALRKRHSRPKGYRGDSDHVGEHMLLPSVNDPSLWLVRCRQGRERDLVMQLMRKYCELEYREEKLEIISAFTRENIVGYVYVEARKMAHVQKALEGVNGVYNAQIKVVPIDDMVSCLKMKSRDKEIKEGSWVRVKKGKYGGDLAKVLEMVDSNSSARVKLVPRIDYSSLDRRRKDDLAGAKRKKTNGPAPPQKLFNPDDVKPLPVARHKGYYIFQDEQYDREGYLEKEIKVASLEIENVNPTLEEISRFTAGSSLAADIASVSLTQTSVEDFTIGENVEVIRGEMKDLIGKVLSIDNGVVTVAPPRETNLSALKFDSKDLRKRFEEGDHVKVINGMHNGETGLVIKISSNIDVFAKDLRQATDVSSGSTAVGAYDVQDAVQISPQEVGVIVKTDKDALTVLNQFGAISKLKVQQIVRKLDRKRALASDSNGKAVGAGDSVLVSDPGAGGGSRRGTVIHIYRSFIFVLSRENSNDSSTSFGRPPARPFGSSAGRGRGRGRDPLISKTVTIKYGPYKGYIGIVKDMTDNGARVELHTSQKLITVPVDKLNVHGSTGAPSHSSDFAYGSRYGQGYRYGEGSATPMHNSAGSRTPMHSGSRTPLHRPSGGMTPNPYNDGSRTPAWDSGSRTPGYSGSRTPAWEPGSRTPARDRDAVWDAGSKTPARPTLASTPREEPETPYNPSTPHQYGGNTDQATPYNPQTPGYTSSIPHTPGVGGREVDVSEMGQYPNPSSVPNTGGMRGPTTPFNPSTPYNPTTPFPSTPHASTSADSYYSHYTTGAEDLEAWLSINIEVKIRHGSQFKNGQYDGQKAVVKVVEDPRTARISLYGASDETHQVGIENLEPVRPEKKNSVKVIAGEFKGRVGVLVGIDEADGVVSLNSPGTEVSYKIIPLRHLVKYVG